MMLLVHDVYSKVVWRQDAVRSSVLRQRPRYLWNADCWPPKTPPRQGSFLLLRELQSFQVHVA